MCEVFDAVEIREGDEINNAVKAAFIAAKKVVAVYSRKNGNIDRAVDAFEKAMELLGGVVIATGKRADGYFDALMSKNDDEYMIDNPKGTKPGDKVAGCTVLVDYKKGIIVFDASDGSVQDDGVALLDGDTATSVVEFR
jgi:hypothetical protein